MHVAADAASAEEGPTDQRRDHAGRQSFWVVGFADDLIDRRSAGFRFAAGRFGRESSGSSIKVSVDAGFVTANLVDIPHDQQFVGERFEWLENSVESFGLKWRRDAKSEEDVKGPDRGGGRLFIRSGKCHLFEKRQPDRDGSQTFQRCTASDASVGHCFDSV